MLGLCLLLWCVGYGFMLGFTERYETDNWRSFFKRFLYEYTSWPVLLGRAVKQEIRGFRGFMFNASRRR